MTWALFLGLLIKSSMVAGVGLIASRWVVSRARDRVDVLRLSVGLLAILPLIALFGPQFSVSVPFLPDFGPVDLGYSMPGPDPLWAGSTPPVAGFVASGVLWRPAPAVIAASIWAVGVLIVVARLGLGVWTLSRWTFSGRPIHDPAWAQQIERLNRASRPRLVSSPEVRSPLSWGLSPGAILIDADSLKAGSSAAAAILAHEMAHLKRADWAFLMLSRLVLALFWFNPLVWWLAKSLVERSEEAADAEAISHVDRHAYARVLITLAAAPCPAIHPTGALAMAAQPHSLKKRIACIMNAPKADPRRPLVVGLTIAALVALATPLAALDLHGRAPGPPPPAEAPAAPLPPILPVPMTYADVAPPPPPPAPAAPPFLVEAQAMPPAPPATPAPPVPPAPPARQNGSGNSTHTVWSNDNDRYVITVDGLTRDATPQERVQMDAARRSATEARAIAGRARARIGEARVHAAAARSEALRARVLVQPARQEAERARILADQARQTAQQARDQARVQRIAGQVQMRDGARQMHGGAEEMRQEAVRLRDPSYRAQQIERSRGQGRVVTDAELVALSPRLVTRAADIDRRADALALRGSVTR